MAIELAEHGITVNAVAPGEISTPMTGIGFLASPGASYITGTSVVVDGGMLQMGPMAGSHLTSDGWRRP